MQHPPQGAPLPSADDAADVRAGGALRGFVVAEEAVRAAQVRWSCSTARLDACRALNASGIPSSVLMAPILPYLSDTPEQLEAAVRAIVRAGAVSITPIVLHLRPGAREWYFAWLARRHPQLVGRYRRLYGDGAYAPEWYQRRIVRQVRELAAAHGLGPADRGSRGEPAAVASPPPAAEPRAEPEPVQLSLL